MKPLKVPVVAPNPPARTEKLVIKMDRDVHDRLVVEAKRVGVTPAALARLFIADGLDRRKLAMLTAQVEAAS